MIMVVTDGYTVVSGAFTHIILGFKIFKALAAVNLFLRGSI